MIFFLHQWRISEDAVVELGVPNISDMKTFYIVGRAMEHQEELLPVVH
jgi:hypothetical protein